MHHIHVSITTQPCTGLIRQLTNKLVLNNVTQQNIDKKRHQNDPNGGNKRESARTATKASNDTRDAAITVGATSQIHPPSVLELRSVSSMFYCTPQHDHSTGK